eukprot:3511475-Pyramimonas_sp.AAC.1
MDTSGLPDVFVCSGVRPAAAAAPYRIPQWSYTCAASVARQTKNATILSEVFCPACAPCLHQPSGVHRGAAAAAPAGAACRLGPM